MLMQASIDGNKKDNKKGDSSNKGHHNNDDDNVFGLATFSWLVAGCHHGRLGGSTSSAAEGSGSM